MPFEPGRSGNPKGRRAEDRKIKLLARQHTEKAVKVLAKHLDSEVPQAAIAAANALLDRGYGKPKQTVDSQVTKRIVNESKIRSIRDQLKEASSRSRVQ